jgi:hypothetical protein
MSNTVGGPEFVSTTGPKFMDTARGEVDVGYLVRIYLKREPDQNIVNIGEQ